MANRMHHAVITGGTGSLGRAVAAALQAPDWSIESPGSRDLDVTDPQAIRNYFRDRPVDLLVCAAGMTCDAPLARVPENVWNQTWRVNFTGASQCAEAVIPGMAARGGGQIVFVSSFSALHPPAGQVAYATAKAALLGLVRDLAIRHGPANIRVNAILPGFLDTAMTSPVSDQRRATVLGEHTLGRLNTCHDAANFLRFLHEEMPHTSGQTFQLDSRPPFR